MSLNAVSSLTGADQTSINLKASTLKYLFPLLMTLAGLAAWAGIISLLIAWWAICFGTVIVGVAMLIFAPHLLLLPLMLSPFANLLLGLGVVGYFHTNEPDDFSNDSLNSGAYNAHSNNQGVTYVQSDTGIKPDVQPTSILTLDEASKGLEPEKAKKRFSWISIVCIGSLLSAIIYILIIPTNEGQNVNSSSTSLTKLEATSAHSKQETTPKSQSSTSNTIWQYKQYELITMFNNDILAYTHGAKYRGNFVGTHLFFDSCSINDTYLHLLVNERNYEHLDKAVMSGAKINARFTFGDKDSILLTGIVNSTYTKGSNHKFASFFFAGPNPELLKLMKAASIVEVEISSRDNPRIIDRDGERFSLSGYTATYNKALDLCNKKSLKF
ncbi:hypothetical protein [Vibrio breoganii]|uniref:hypothetical protein n=1 Tax=Vibrio breoganii TaxID=553239 RepID=UPI0002D6FB4B|nr:hypothetical protein [Vibrio breoganii]OED96817.1 hypothetical protein A1QG_16275 [Vibrio breoganii ZF-29]